MRVVRSIYYMNVNEYLPGHVALSLLSDNHTGEPIYINTENSSEYRLLFKLRRITNYSMYQMVKGTVTDFSWNKI